MIPKMVATLIAVALMLGYLAPLLVKMKDLALGGVILIGFVVMLADLWQTLRESDD